MNSTQQQSRYASLFNYKIQINNYTHQTCTHTHTVLTAILQVNLGKSVAPSVVLTGRQNCHKVIEPAPHPLISTIMAKGFGCKVFTGQIPFVLANQQCQSTKEKTLDYNVQTIKGTKTTCISVSSLLIYTLV